MNMSSATDDRGLTRKCLTGRSLPSAGSTEFIEVLTPRSSPHSVFATLFGNTCIWPQASGYYWQQSRRPLGCLAFVAPLLVLYEGGVLGLGSQAMRNGADVW